MSSEKHKVYFVGTFRAFSLVEVTLALGLIAFCLVALLGLFQAGLQMERRSVDQARAAFILTAVVDDLTGAARKPTSLGVGPSTESQTAGYGIQIPPYGGDAANIALRLDSSGKIISGAENNSYVVLIQIDPPSKTEGVFVPYKLRLIVAWPGSAEFQGAGNSLQLSKARGSIETTLELNRG